MEQSGVDGKTILVMWVVVRGLNGSGMTSASRFLDG